MAQKTQTGVLYQPRGVGWGGGWEGGLYMYVCVHVYKDAWLDQIKEKKIIRCPF